MAAAASVFVIHPDPLQHGAASEFPFLASFHDSHLFHNDVVPVPEGEPTLAILLAGREEALEHVSIGEGVPTLSVHLVLLPVATIDVSIGESELPVVVASKFSPSATTRFNVDCTYKAPGNDVGVEGYTYVPGVV